MGPAPVDQDAPGKPGGAGTDAADVVPGFGDDAGWFHEDGELPERLRYRDGGIDGEQVPFGGEAVELLDSVLRITAVAAHVPLADGARAAGHWIGPAHDADDEVSQRKR
jgi:hypothetical protein